MDFTWREKRKYFIIFIAIIFILAYAFYRLYPNLFPASTYNDGIQNLDERGIDCGGAGIKICPKDIIPLSVKFTKAVESEKDLYDIVALVTNKNYDKTTIDGNINFNFTIYDKSGSIIQVINSSTSIPLGQDFPIVIQNVYLPLSDSGNSISNISLDFINDKVWYPINPSFANIFFKNTYINFQNGKGDGINPSRLTVQIQNLTKNYFRNISIRVIVYDKDYNVLATNDTLADEINPDQLKTVLLTWRNKFNKEVFKVDVYPIVTPMTYFK